MKATHVEHIGIAVKDLEKSVAFYEKLLGVRCYGTELVQDQNARTAFFLLGQTKIELLESISSDGPIARFITDRGEGIHHIAFAVEDLQSALGELSLQGVQLVDHTPRSGAEGLEIAFLHPKVAGGVLIELCAHPRDTESPEVTTT